MLNSSKMANVIEIEQINVAFGSAVWTKGQQWVEIHSERPCISNHKICSSKLVCSTKESGVYREEPVKFPSQSEILALAFWCRPQQAEIFLLSFLGYFLIFLWPKNNKKYTFCTL